MDQLERLTRWRLDAQRMEYAEQIKLWRSLETKAQGTAGIAGIFLGGILAFIRDIDGGTANLEAWVASAAVVCLVISVLYGIRALYLRDVPSRPSSNLVESMYRDALGPFSDPSSREHLQEWIVGLLGDEGNQWQRLNAKLSEVNAQKGDFVRVAHCWLFVAIVFGGVLSIIIALGNAGG